MKTREQAMQWWNALPEPIQIDRWFIYRENRFTMSTGPKGLTGREIESIWKQEMDTYEKADNINS